MKILGIETSCDETALSIVEADGTVEKPRINVLAHTVLSQIKIHEKHGGVFPMLAKREHGKNLIPVLKKVLRESNYIKIKNIKLTKSESDLIEKILERESELKKRFFEFVKTVEKPPLDYIAVTHGPGLEPALWVGINFAKALSVVWNIPVIPVNHMEGHIAAVLFDNNEKLKKSSLLFPAVALLISGGHTELVLIKKWGNYEIVGETQDDAVGEAFDKVGRMLGLSYPAGPAISRLASEDRDIRPVGKTYHFPRPMIHSNDLNFSFSGLKTSVLYTLKKIPKKNNTVIREISREFEDAVVEVLISKTTRALEKYCPRTLILGGGVSANSEIRRAFESLCENRDIDLYIPDKSLATDNALMIAAAGYINILESKSEKKKFDFDTPRPQGNLRLS